MKLIDYTLLALVALMVYGAFRLYNHRKQNGSSCCGGSGGCSGCSGCHAGSGSVNGSGSSCHGNCSCCSGGKKS